jgi:hypothetical protein
MWQKSKCVASYSTGSSITSEVKKQKHQLRSLWHQAKVWWASLTETLKELKLVQNGQGVTHDWPYTMMRITDKCIFSDGQPQSNKYYLQELEVYTGAVWFARFDNSAPAWNYRCWIKGIYTVHLKCAWHRPPFGGQGRSLPFIWVTTIKG